jgi:hypothetical protein
MAARRPASKILWVAAALGASLIFASTLVSELRRTRGERACAAGEIAACVAGCRKGGTRSCGELERRCTAGERAACHGLEGSKGDRGRRARW